MHSKQRLLRRRKRSAGFRLFTALLKGDDLGQCRVGRRQITFRIAIAAPWRTAALFFPNSIRPRRSSRILLKIQVPVAAPGISRSAGRL